jgi:hypothetical protein
MPRRDENYFYGIGITSLFIDYWCVYPTKINAMAYKG